MVGAPKSEECITCVIEAIKTISIRAKGLSEIESLRIPCQTLSKDSIKKFDNVKVMVKKGKLGLYLAKNQNKIKNFAIYVINGANPDKAKAYVNEKTSSIIITENEDCSLDIVRGKPDKFKDIEVVIKS